MLRRVRHINKRFARDDEGAVLVEFAIVFPMMILFLAIVLDFGTTFYSYQQTISGVRDASRYLGRAAPITSCPGWTAQDLTMKSKLTSIVNQDIEATSSTIFPKRVSVTNVFYSINCIEDAVSQDLYAEDMVMVGRVTAVIEIDFPLGGVFGLFGSDIPGIRTRVSDEMRIYGI